MSTAEPVRSFLFQESPYDYSDDRFGRAPAKKNESGFIGSVRTDRLTDIFNKFASDAMRDFPKLRGSFMLIDGKTGEAIGEVAPGKLVGNAQDVATYLANRHYGGYADTVKIDANTSELVNEGDLYAIRYNMFMPFSQNAEQDLQFSLDHELGHAVVPGAIDPFDINYDEMAGDVFAMLKHIQQFGDDNGSYLTLLARKRTEGLLMGDPTHFTNPALTLFAAQKGQLDISNMTPEQMTTTAASIAGESKLTPQKMRAISNIMGRAQKRFSQYARQTGRQDLGSFLSILTTELLKPDVYKPEFEIGLEVIKPFMKDIPGVPRVLPINHPKWVEIGQGLEEKARTVQDAPKQPVQQGGGLQKAFPHVEHQARREPQQPAYSGGGWQDFLEDLMRRSGGGLPRPLPRRNPGFSGGF